MRFVLFLLMFAIALVAQAPAWLLAKPLRDATAGWVELRGLAGTLWHGAADVVLSAPSAPARGFGAGRFEWTVRPADLLRGAVTADIDTGVASAARISHGPPPRPLTISARSGDRLDVSGSVRLPVAAIGLVPLLPGWTASGDAVADIPALQWSGGAANGAMTIRWRGAHVVPPDLVGGLSLGDANATLTASAGAMTVQVRNAGGDVDLAVNAASRTRSIAITLQPRPSATPQQLAWLQSHTMGRTAAGGFRIDAGWP